MKKASASAGTIKLAAPSKLYLAIANAIPAAI